MSVPDLVPDDDDDDDDERTLVDMFRNYQHFKNSTKIESSSSSSGTRSGTDIGDHGMPLVSQLRFS